MNRRMDGWVNDGWPGGSESRVSGMDMASRPLCLLLHRLHEFRADQGGFSPHALSDMPPKHRTGPFAHRKSTASAQRAWPAFATSGPLCRQTCPAGYGKDRGLSGKDAACLRGSQTGSWEEWGPGAEARSDTGKVKTRKTQEAWERHRPFGRREVETGRATRGASQGRGGGPGACRRWGPEDICSSGRCARRLSPQRAAIQADGAELALSWGGNRGAEGQPTGRV